MATTNTMKMKVMFRDNRDLPATAGLITHVVWTESERFKNAFKTLGMWLLFTFLSVFVPLLHFVLTPALLVASFVLAINAFGEKERNLGGKAECTRCHKETIVQPSRQFERVVNNCEACGADLELTPA